MNNNQIVRRRLRSRLLEEIAREDMGYEETQDHRGRKETLNGDDGDLNGTNFCVLHEERLSDLRPLGRLEESVNVDLIV